MGYQKTQSYALVSMSNKDVYYISVEAAKELMAAARQGDPTVFIETIDVKNRTRVMLNPQLVSSVVVREASDA